MVQWPVFLRETAHRLKDLARNVYGIQLISFQRGKIQRNSKPVGEVCLSSSWDVSADKKATQNFPLMLQIPSVTRFVLGNMFPMGLSVSVALPSSLAFLSSAF